MVYWKWIKDNGLLFVTVFVVSCSYCVIYIQQASVSVLQRPGRFPLPIPIFSEEHFGFWKCLPSSSDTMVTGYGQRWVSCRCASTPHGTKSLRNMTCILFTCWWLMWPSDLDSKRLSSSAQLAVNIEFLGLVFQLPFSHRPWFIS